MAEQAPSAETVPEHQDRGLFGLFGKKKEDDKITPPPSTHTQITPPTSTHTQTQSAHLYPTNPPHSAAVDQQYGQGYGHGHEGQFTAGEAGKQQHTGLLGKLHRTNSSSSSSSSDEEEGGKKKEGGRKKKGIKDKIKEKLPGGQHSSEQYGHEGEKKGLVDKIKDKLPGHHDKE
jgi:hypothetical protein